jgi:chromosome segregation ATPase
VKHFLLSAAIVFLPVAQPCFAQSTSAGSQSQSDATKPSMQSATPAPAAAVGDQDKDKQDKTKKKAKKVWTNDEISTVSGGISVVGDSSASAPASGNSAQARAGEDSSEKDKLAAHYRDQLQELRAQLDAADKKISDTRNFKADNTSSSGGINISKAYSMTPMEDQIKQLEEKKKQIQARIDDLENEARKNGISAGQLR